MEQRPIVWPMLGASLGIGLGLGIWITNSHHQQSPPTHPSSSSSSSSSSPPLELFQHELMSMVTDGKHNNVTFDHFPYFLDDTTKVLLMSVAVLHLNRRSFRRKFAHKLVPASQAILLQGPPGAEIYHRMLAKALSHKFEAKLLILDVKDFSLKLHAKYGNWRKARSGSITGLSLEKFIGLAFSKVASIYNNSLARKKGNESEEWKGELSHKDSSQRQSISWEFNDTTLIEALSQVILKLTKEGPSILYLRDVDKFFPLGSKSHASLQTMIQNISGPVLIFGSILVDLYSEQEDYTTDEIVGSLFPYIIDIKSPDDSVVFSSWKSQLEEDLKATQKQDNMNHILELLLDNDVECNDLDSISFNDSAILSDYMEEIVVSAISHHIMNVEEPQYQEGRLVISCKSLTYGLNLFRTDRIESQDAKIQTDSSADLSKGKDSEGCKTGSTKANELKKAGVDRSKEDESKKASVEFSNMISIQKPVELHPDNEYEKRIRPEVIPVGQVGVSFEDIGALENVKEILQEVVMLPLRRPDLFNQGGLLKPCRGVLLFGPPGTGKTMLAKAVATEAGASFISVSMSTITSKWFGEDEKNVRAIFTLAAKVAPAVIFIDEVDSLLGQRSSKEHEAMRKIKNEFMAHWDGLLTIAEQKILVLAATNRPFDLDDAVIRRFQRRIMIGLPEKESREKILRSIMENEYLANDIDFSELATITEGYSGSDLKNLCTVAAYRPVRDLLRQETQEAEKKKTIKLSEALKRRNEKNREESNEDYSEGSQISSDDDNFSGHPLPQLRCLTMEDLRQTQLQITPSFASEGIGMNELKDWNELYGEGASRKKKQLPHFI